MAPPLGAPPRARRAPHVTSRPAPPAQATPLSAPAPAAAFTTSRVQFSFHLQVPGSTPACHPARRVRTQVADAAPEVNQLTTKVICLLLLGWQGPPVLQPPLHQVFSY